jgi:hypothetical protein
MLSIRWCYRSITSSGNVIIPSCGLSLPRTLPILIACRHSSIAVSTPTLSSLSSAPIAASGKGNRGATQRRITTATSSTNGSNDSDESITMALSDDGFPKSVLSPKSLEAKRADDFDIDDAIIANANIASHVEKRAIHVTQQLHQLVASWQRSSTPSNPDTSSNNTNNLNVNTSNNDNDISIRGVAPTPFLFLRPIAMANATNTKNNNDNSSHTDGMMSSLSNLPEHIRSLINVESKDRWLRYGLQLNDVLRYQQHTSFYAVARNVAAHATSLPLSTILRTCHLICQLPSALPQLEHGMIRALTTALMARCHAITILTNATKGLNDTDINTKILNDPTLMRYRRNALRHAFHTPSFHPRSLPIPQWTPQELIILLHTVNRLYPYETPSLYHTSVNVNGQRRMLPTAVATGNDGMTSERYIDINDIHPITGVLRGPSSKTRNDDSINGIDDDVYSERPSVHTSSHLAHFTIPHVMHDDAWRRAITRVIHHVLDSCIDGPLSMSNMGGWSPHQLAILVDWLSIWRIDNITMISHQLQRLICHMYDRYGTNYMTPSLLYAIALRIQQLHAYGTTTSSLSSDSTVMLPPFQKLLIHHNIVSSDDLSHLSLMPPPTASVFRPVTAVAVVAAEPITS